MNFDGIKEELKEKFGNHCYESNAYSNNLICWAMSERADYDITA